MTLLTAKWRVQKTSFDRASQLCWCGGGERDAKCVTESVSVLLCIAGCVVALTSAYNGRALA